MGLDSLKQQISDWKLAKFLHEYYEKYAEQQGWETQKECKVSFENLPKKNKSVMLLVSVQVKKFVLGLLADYEKNHVIFPIEKIKDMKLLERAKILLSDHIIIPTKQLEELFDNRPSSCCDVHHAEPIEYENWICKLREKLLEASK